MIRPKLPALLLICFGVLLTVGPIVDGLFSKVAAGKQLIDQFAPLLPDPGRQQDQDAVLSKLTDRERTVFEQLAAGRSNREIATALHLSEGTVKIHVGRILAKLDLRDRVQAVVLAYESGLITPGG